MALIVMGYGSIKTALDSLGLEAIGVAAEGVRALAGPDAEDAYHREAGGSASQ